MDGIFEWKMKSALQFKKKETMPGIRITNYRKCGDNSTKVKVHERTGLH